MKRLLILAILLLYQLDGYSQFKAGAGFAFLVDGTYLGLTGKGHYTIDEDMMGQASFSYYFDSFRAWTFDLDFHYDGLGDWSVAEFKITPFAGFNFWRYGRSGYGRSRLNINLGVNATTELGELELFIEPKIILGRSSNFSLAGGVYF